MINIENAKSLEPKRVISERENEGEVVCNCGEQFAYSLTGSVNMGSWFGFTVPICPKCGTIPASKTRRMDL